VLTSPRPDEVDPDRLPSWATPPAPDVAAPPAVWKGVALRMAGAGLVASILFWLEHYRAPILLLTLAVLSSIASFLIPSFGRGIDRFIAWFQRFVGRALTVILLGAVYLAIFIPVSLVLRLFRQDPLALGAAPDDPTFWREAARRGGKPLYRRPFTYERHPASFVRRRGLSGIRSALGLVALLGLLDLGIGSAVDAARNPAAAAAAGETATQSLLVKVDANADEPWAAQLFRELDASYERSEYHPYRGWSVSDHRGRHVNVRNEIRRSYQADLTGAGRPIEVFFFGGSTMMGWYQRDDHTIPSEFVKLAEADGIPVRAVNYGQPAYQNWQEVLLLQEQLSAGKVPDLVVFYDGANEVGTQFRSGPSTDPTHIQAREIEDRLESAGQSGVVTGSVIDQLTGAYAEASAVGEVVRAVTGSKPRTRLWAPWPDQRERPVARGRAAAEVYERGVDLAVNLSESYGFDTAFFWQPWIYSKGAVEGEEAAYGSWGTHPASWRTAGNAARHQLGDPVVDLSDVLDDIDEPIMYDFVHTNEQGAAVVAEALYEQLKPRLLELGEEAR
jgi:lysophospholipase L1-like esterase